MTNTIRNVYIKDSYTIAGMYERDGFIGKLFDKIYDKDFYYGMSTFEDSESKMLSDSIEGLMKKVNLKDGNIDFVLAGDLQNQIAGSDYALKNFDIPFLGIFSACATFGEGLIIGSDFLNGKKNKNIIVGTSSHNMVAERQFRNPTEYGALKKKTTTFTSTGAASVLLTNEKSKVKITNTTMGRVKDGKINDVNHMGAVMAIAACDTLKRHFEDLGIKPDYYDLILTGDLGIYGKRIVIDYMREFGYDMSKNYDDCGLILYDIKKQEVFAGASGPASSALVFSSYVFKEMEKGKLRKVLLVPTGAIFSPTRVFQGSSIPSIAHAISLEVNLE